MIVLMNESNFRKRSEMWIFFKNKWRGRVENILDFVRFQVKTDESCKPDNSKLMTHWSSLIVFLFFTGKHQSTILQV